MKLKTNLTRYDPHSISLFQTFPAKELPSHLDVLYGDTPPDFECLLDYGLAVVGTRFPQRRSIELMEQTFKSLKGSGLIIVSGFARGIDSRAHELAIDYGLKTIAILGCGIDVNYPRENLHLKHKILESGGCIISEFERDAPPYAGNFTERNRLIAGFAKATWVVEGAAISGTLNTAGWACKFNRELYATSCFPGDPFYQGNEKLLSEKETDKYPIAKPFFNVQSFSPSWERFGNPKSKQLDFASLKATLSSIQLWITELQASHGVCQVQALMNWAYQKGLTPGNFYLQFEEEIQSGRVVHHPDGSVTLGPVA